MTPLRAWSAAPWWRVAAVLLLAWSCSRTDPTPTGRAASDGSALPERGVASAGAIETAALPEVRPTALEAHIRFLADDLLEGRGTGTRGYAIAAQYVAARFGDLGLSPAGTAGYLQPVAFRRARISPETSLVLEGAAGKRELALERDYLPVPDFLRESVDVTAPVVFAGFGVTSPTRGYDDYRDVDARGKIVVLLTGAPASFPSTERAHHANPRIKAQNAVAHGAIGVLRVRTRDQSFPWDRFVRQSRPGTLRWLDEDGEPKDVFPQLRGVATLSASGAETLFEGASRSLDEVLTDAEDGRAPPVELPVRATIHTVSRHEKVESPNVAGLLRGADPRLRDEVVVYTAHLDHLGIGEPVAGDSIYNGALDNASGSAALLEIARVFADLPQPPARSILFVAVTGEEEGLLGSDYFAENPTVPIERIVANVNVDGLGILYPLRDVVPMGAEHSTLDVAVQRAASRMGIELAPDPFPQESFFVRSDQYSFVRRGVPSLFLFLGFESDADVDAPALFRQWLATRYHTPQDDLTQPMDMAAGARHAQLNFLVGLEVANAPDAPAWKGDDFFGEMYGQKR